MGTISMMNLEELREVARKNGSINVDLASAWSLRWHDPSWIVIWERWNKARHVWRENMLRWFDDIRLGHGRFEEGDDVYNPNPERIGDPELAAMAREYIEAREAYLGANKLYPGD